MAFNLFIINDEVIFDANADTLKPLGDLGEAITLNAPTSRCLQLLIENKGEMVSRDDFLEQVWQSRGIVVSQNTFYQNISLLRKSLKKSGLTEEIITTVRRRGFSLSSDTRIQSLVDEKIVPQLGFDSDETYEQQQSSSLHDAFSVAVKGDAVGPKRNPTRSELRVPGWLVLLLVIVLVMEIISIMFHYLKS